MLELSTLLRTVLNARWPCATRKNEDCLIRMLACPTFPALPTLSGTRPSSCCTSNDLLCLSLKLSPSTDPLVLPLLVPSTLPQHLNFLLQLARCTTVEPGLNANLNKLQFRGPLYKSISCEQLKRRALSVVDGARRFCACMLLVLRGMLDFFYHLCTQYWSNITHY